VSRVINDRPNVDPETRTRVLRAIAELEYVPSAAARRLSLGRTQSIAVAVPFMTTPSVVERLRGIESRLVVAGLDMVVFNVETVERRDAVLRELPHPVRYDGMLLVSLPPRDHEVRQIRRSGMPTVLVDAHHDLLPSVVVDDVEGGRLAARHLLELGHRRIGFVGDLPRPEFGFTSSQHRRQGADEVLRSEGLAMPDSAVGLGEPTRACARELAAKILRHSRPPTAVMVASDVQALGVLEAAHDAGIDVPGKLSVIGYDDIEAADYLGLTTIHQPLFETGERGADRLVDAIGGGTLEPVGEVLAVRLVARRTTAPRPA